MQLFSKINNICFNISRFISANGPGRSVGVSESTEVGDPSGFATFFKQVFTNIGEALVNFGEFILRCLARLAYFIVTIALNLMDFMNVVIKELSGQASAYSIAENSNLEDSDLLFQFLFNELTIKVLENVFVFAILLLIIFTIMAIVKQEWQNHITGKQNNVKKIFKKVLLSIFSMILVPFILIVGIVFSNVVLSSAMSALTGGDQSFSLGAQIFSASSYEANKYRQYAQEGMKIPIVFDYDGGFENTVTTTFPEMTESSTKAYEQQLQSLLESGNFETGQSTYNMFKEENFFVFSGISDSSNYYSIYDGGYLKTKQIEYYAMADFLDFALSSGGNFYVVNAEKVYLKALNYIDIYKDEKPLDLDETVTPDKKETDEEKAERERREFIHDSLWTVLDGIVAYDENGDILLQTDDPATVDVSERASSDDVYEIASKVLEGSIVLDQVEFKVYYNEGRAEAISTPGIESADSGNAGTLTYTSRAGSTDEVTGAKYLVCHRYSLDEDGNFIYLPVQLGDKVNGMTFKSNFLQPAPTTEDGQDTLREETFFIARGIFTSAGYPTAIREEGSNIVYYRQDPQSPSTFNFSEIFNYQTPSDLASGEDNATGGSSSIGDMVEFLTGVDVSGLIPDIQINLNFLRAFTKSEVTGAISEGGRFTVNYSFVGCGFTMHNLYDELSINYVVLIFAVCLLFKSLFYIIWGLIKRIFEITLLWITFPGYVAKFPIEKAENIGDSGTAFTNWKERMIERVMALYSIYLALAIVFLLIPVVFSMDYITAFNIEEGNIFGIFNADIANLVIKTAFVLALFSFLNIQDNSQGTAGAPRIIEQIILWTSSNPESGYLTNIGQETVADIKAMGSKAVASFTIGGMIKTVKGAALNTARGVGNAIPGRNLFDRAVDMTNKGFNKRNDAMLRNAQTDFASEDSSDSAVEAQTKKLNQATQDHAQMEEYRKASRDHNRETGKGLDKDFRATRGNSANMDARMKDVAKSGGGKKIKLGKKKTTERREYRETRDRTGV